MSKLLADQLKDLGLNKQRPDGRQPNELRKIAFTRHFTKHAEGSVLVEFGDTKVICTASVDRGVPRFLRGSGSGWVTAEYSMLPRATHSRTEREVNRGKAGGRTLEIQRLIARSLRAAVNLKKLGENTITLDCDVIQADGGTRTAAISGACIALAEAIKFLQQDKNGAVRGNPFIGMVAAVSVGIWKEQAILDLNYKEDSTAETDMNVIMTEAGGFVEIQGTAETKSFSQDELNTMLSLGSEGIKQIIALQKAALQS